MDIVSRAERERRVSSSVDSDQRWAGEQVVALTVEDVESTSSGSSGFAMAMEILR